MELLQSSIMFFHYRNLPIFMVHYSSCFLKLSIPKKFVSKKPKKNLGKTVKITENEFSIKPILLIGHTSKIIIEKT